MGTDMNTNEQEITAEEVMTIEDEITNDDTINEEEIGTEEVVTNEKAITTNETLSNIEESLKSLSEGNFDFPNIEYTDGRVSNICSYINKIKEQLSYSLSSSTEIVTKVSEGMVDDRIDTLDLNGSYVTILENTNYTIDLTISAFRDLGETVEKLANGDMSARITNDYMGDLGYFKTIVNDLAESLLD